MKKEKKVIGAGLISLVAFVIWTVLIQQVDVQPVGQNGTDIGFATLNCWFHKLTGVHMAIYHITDWLGLVPLFICMVFGIIGLIQLIKRKSLFKVDIDIIILGIYYILVILGYLIFEMIPINYRPILINGVMEASYPSSTTLLVLCVMPTLNFQVKRRIKNETIINVINTVSILFSLFMVIGRTVSGVHWLTDIIGSVILSTGLFLIYISCVLLLDKTKTCKEVSPWNSVKSFKN
ncbi:MAG: phosphatase PAP2 family protein [Christensenellaceae bacterium]